MDSTKIKHPYAPVTQCQQLHFGHYKNAIKKKMNNFTWPLPLTQNTSTNVMLQRHAAYKKEYHVNNKISTFHKSSLLITPPPTHKNRHILKIPKKDIIICKGGLKDTGTSYSPNNIKIKQLLGEGSFGEVFQVTFNINY